MCVTYTSSQTTYIKDSLAGWIQGSPKSPLCLLKNSNWLCLPSPYQGNTRTLLPHWQGKSPPQSPPRKKTSVSQGSWFEMGSQRHLSKFCTCQERSKFRGENSDCGKDKRWSPGAVWGDLLSKQRSNGTNSMSLEPAGVQSSSCSNYTCSWSRYAQSMQLTTSHSLLVCQDQDKWEDQASQPSPCINPACFSSESRPQRSQGLWQISQQSSTCRIQGSWDSFTRANGCLHEEQTSSMRTGEMMPLSSDEEKDALGRGAEAARHLPCLFCSRILSQDLLRIPKETFWAYQSAG